MTSIKIPDGVTSIGSGAFEGCSSLISIEIPDGVTSLGYGTFRGCRSLTSVKIPKSVTDIKDSYDYSRLTSIKVSRGSYAEIWAKDNGFADKIEYID